MKLLSSSIKKIAIFRALQLGDMLCAIPAIRSLRFAFPTAEITLIGLPWAHQLVARYEKYIDRFIHFPGYPGLPEQPFNPEAFNAFLDHVRAENFDVVLQMQGNGTIVNSMILLFKAKAIAGFHNADSRMSSELFMSYPDKGSEVHRHLALMDHIGVPSLGDELEFPLTQNDYSAYDEVGFSKEEGKYVCIHPGSRSSWRRWPAGYFAAVADQCAFDGFRVVITGTNEESSISHSVASLMRNPSVNLTGKTSLGAMAILLKDASLLVSNCTGTSHLAAAMRTPSVVINMDGEPARWAPINHQLHTTFDCRHDFKLKEVLAEAQRRLHTEYADLDHPVEVPII
jgi:ADP-heptose:LPS heptosyltransferase